MCVPHLLRGMATGGTWTAGGGPGLAVTTVGPTHPADRLPEEVDRRVVDAAAAADLLVIDRRRSDTRAPEPGTAAIADRQVLVVPRQPGARPEVTCYSRDDPETDPAVELIRRTVELDATAAAHYTVAAAVAVASDGEPTHAAENGSSDDWTQGSDPVVELEAEMDEREGTAAPTGHASVAPSTAELAARRDSLDTAAERVLDGGPESAAPLAFCGLAGVVDPLDSSP